jgi:hypothetical protein
MGCPHVVCYERNPFSAQHKIRISRNNICQLVLAKPYGINETLVAINKLVTKIIF